MFGVSCRGFLGTRLGLRCPLPQGFVLTGNVPLKGRGAQGTWARGVQMRSRDRTLGYREEAGHAGLARFEPLRPSGVACESQGCSFGWCHSRSQR